MSSSQDSGKTLSHYRLIEKIGEGGMGVVWKAEDTILGRTVAVKVLPKDVSSDPERRKMFLDEARLASSVSEAHIVQVHEFGTEGALDFIVMEYVEGRPLSKLIQGRPLPPEQVAEWGSQIARALSRAHRKGLLHRDLKPANILITADGDAKVADFGLATLFDRGESSSSGLSQLETRTSLEGAGTSGGGIAGTIPYMSPEQLRAEPLNVHSDIFSLGVVLYEMTTGVRPFQGATSTEVVDNILKARPKPAHERVATVPLDLERILQKAMAPRPADRYQTMEDLAVDLRRLGRDLETGSSPAYDDLVRAAESRQPERRKGLPPLAVAAVLLVAAIGFGAWLTGRLGPSGPPVDQRTVLIPPMEIRGQTEGADYAGRAFAEALAVNLARSKDLRVLPVPAEFPPVGAGRASRARELGAGVLLTGAITREGEKVHASVSLIDTRENRILWGEQREDTAGDLAGLAAILARAGADELGLGPRTAVYDASMNLTGSPAMAASTEFAETMGAIRRRQLNQAVEASARLLAAFPDEFDAHAIRAAALVSHFFDYQAATTAGSLTRVVEAMEAMDPDSPYPLLYGPIATIDWVALQANADILAARTDLTPALRAEVLLWRSWSYRNLGDPERGVVELEAAVRLAPADANLLANLGYVLREVGRHEEALARARQAVALEPSVWLYHHSLGHVLHGAKRFDEAAASYRRGCEIIRTQQPCAALAGALLYGGHRDEALEIAREATAMRDTLAGTYNLACFWAVAGDVELSLDLLRRAVDLGFSSEWMAADPDLESLHGNPEFEAVLDDMRRRRDERPAA